MVARGMFNVKEIDELNMERVKIHSLNLQKYEVDCGIFIIAFANTFMWGVAANFQQDDVKNHLRLHVAADIVRGSLSSVTVSNTRKYFVTYTEKQELNDVIWSDRVSHRQLTRLSGLIVLTLNKLPVNGYLIESTS